MSNNRRGWCAACLGAMMLLALPAPAMTITYSNFSDLSGFTLNGTTAVIHPGGAPVLDDLGAYVLRLTNNLSQSGSAFLTSTVALNNQASFSTYFTFRISQPMGMSDVDGQGADGIVFVVQTVGNNVGGTGGGIGYQGISPSVGVEFDTWNNGTWDDNDGNHLGIDLNGNIDSVVQIHIPTRMNDGHIWHSWVDYNGVTNALEVRLALSSARPTLPDLSYVVNLQALLGTPNAYVGFTSGTGGAGGVHDIRTWELRDNFDPINVPEPATMCLLAGGLASLLATRGRRRR